MDMAVHKPIKVLVLAYPGVSLLDLGGPLETLCAASLHPQMQHRRPAYDCTVVSIDGGPVTTSDGVALVTEPVSAFDRVAADTLIVPGAFTVEEVIADPALIEWLRHAAVRFRRICSVCAGSFLLAEAGLLDGKRATTHWLHRHRLAREHESIAVEQDAIFVRDGSVWCSAGVTTGIDMALALVEEDCGRAIALHVARILVVYLKRSGGQSQYSALLAAQVAASDDRFDQLDRWILENLTEDLRIERLAERVGMSPRNFARVYRQERGRTPAKVVETLRIDAARRMLEETRHRIPDIALRCGFGDESAMRSAFTRQMGISPRDYRERFAVYARE